jgi:hypothetical protein
MSRINQFYEAMPSASHKAVSVQNKASETLMPVEYAARSRRLRGDEFADAPCTEIGNSSGMPSVIKNHLADRKTYSMAVAKFYELGGTPRVDERTLSPVQKRAWELVQRAKEAVDLSELRVRSAARTNPRIKLK